MKYPRIALTGAALIAIAASAAFGEEEQDVALADVPAAVIAAAEREVPGFKAKEAEMEVEDGKTIYELEGKANGTEYEIEVSADGEVLEVEEDD